MVQVLRISDHGAKAMQYYILFLFNFNERRARFFEITSRYYTYV